jgi:poly(A) polymerase
VTVAVDILHRILAAAAPSGVLDRWLRDTGTFPEVLALDGHDDATTGRHKDMYAHTLAVVDRCPRRLVPRLAAVFHDVGKPPTKRVAADGTVTFHDHETVGAAMTARALTRAGFDADLADRVARIVALSGRAGGYEPGWSDAAVRRLRRDAGDVWDDLCAFVAVDCTSKHLDRRRRARERIVALRARAETVAAADKDAARRPPLHGEQIMAVLGCGPGPLVGAAWRWLRDTHPGVDPDDAVAALRTWAATADAAGDR